MVASLEGERGEAREQREPERDNQASAHRDEPALMAEPERAPAPAEEEARADEGRGTPADPARQEGRGDGQAEGDEPEGSDAIGIEPELGT